jgi:hypothetical protein
VMNSFTIPKGSRVLIGAPKQAKLAEHAGVIRVALEKLPQVKEAHMPQMYAEGTIDPPREVLVIVCEKSAHTEVHCALKNWLEGPQGAVIRRFPVTGLGGFVDSCDTKSGAPHLLLLWWPSSPLGPRPVLLREGRSVRAARC